MNLTVVGPRPWYFNSVFVFPLRWSCRLWSSGFWSRVVLEIVSLLRMEVASSSGNVETTYKTTRCHKPKTYIWLAVLIFSINPMVYNIGNVTEPSELRIFVSSIPFHRRKSVRCEVCFPRQVWNFVTTEIMNFHDNITTSRPLDSSCLQFASLLIARLHLKWGYSCSCEILHDTVIQIKFIGRSSDFLRRKCSACMDGYIFCILTMFKLSDYNHKVTGIDLHLYACANFQASTP